MPRMVSRSGPAVTEGSLAAKRRLASATTRGIAEPAERVDQLAAQDRVIGRARPAAALQPSRRSSGPSLAEA